MWVPVLLFVGGLIVVLVGAEVFVRGAARLARRLGVSALVVGLTIVAIGTSAPEIAVTVTSALRGESNLAVGNIVGSNIFNVLAIIGFAALVKPLTVAIKIIRVDAPIMVAASVVLFIMAYNGTIDRPEAIGLVTGLVAYLFFAYWWGREKKEPTPVAAVFETTVPANGSALMQIAAIVLGAVALTVGSEWMVDGASTIAREMGISDAIIGLTIVAAGTGMPELTTSVVAGVRGEQDIAVGNIVGSNIMNVVAGIGLCALVAPKPVVVDHLMRTQDIPIMLVALVLFWAIVRTGRRVSRAEGGLLAALYLAYLGYSIYRL